jgi:toxin YoeB
LLEDTPKYQIRFAQKDIVEFTNQQKIKLRQILEQVIAVNPHSERALKGKLKGLNSYQIESKESNLV